MYMNGSGKKNGGNGGRSKNGGGKAHSLLEFHSAAAQLKKSSGLSVGVVGCGYWGSKHVRVLSCNPEVSRIVLVDPDAQACAKMMAAFPMCTARRDLETALPDVDAVIVATPPKTHCDIALACLRAGKHVLLEKPIAKSISEALLLLDEARRSDLTLMPGHTFEFNPAVHELKRRVVAGELGDVHYIHSSRLNLGLYRTDVNVVWDLAPHDISIMNYVLDSVPTAVSGWASLNAGDTEDVAFIRLEYGEIGVTGFAHLSWLDPKKTREVTVVGSKKMAVYDDLIDEQLRIFDRGVTQSEGSSFERPLSYRYGDILSPRIDFKEPLALEVEHFLHSVQLGIRSKVDGERGLAVIATLEAIDEAIATGGVVNVRHPGREVRADSRSIRKYPRLSAGAHEHPLGL